MRGVAWFGNLLRQEIACAGGGDGVGHVEAWRFGPGGGWIAVVVGSGWVDYGKNRGPGGPGGRGRWVAGRWGEEGLIGAGTVDLVDRVDGEVGEGEEETIGRYRVDARREGG